MSDTRPPLPPFTEETARRKVRGAEDAWNTRDPEVCARVYTEDTRWRNRAEFPVGREEVKAFLVLREGLQPTEEILRQVIATCEAGLARFKVPRYYSFRHSLPKTPSLKIAKQLLKQDIAVHTAATFDRVANAWTAPEREAAQ